jgi:hypothetical protein
MKKLQPLQTGEHDNAIMIIKWIILNLPGESSTSTYHQVERSKRRRDRKANIVAFIKILLIISSFSALDERPRAVLHIYDSVSE